MRAPCRVIQQSALRPATVTRIAACRSVIVAPDSPNGGVAEGIPNRRDVRSGRYAPIPQ